MKYLNDLLFWVHERERIKTKKDRGDPRPWTTDPILSAYRFCNVRREDDTVTKWIHDNWLTPHYADASLPFAMCVARMVNLPETLEMLGYPNEWDPELFIRVIHNRKAAGLKAWTSAYMITGGYSAGGEAKEVIIARVLSQAYANLNTTHGCIVRGDSLAVMASKIKCPGMGTFLSAQVVADLKWSPVYGPRAADWNTWCAPGPGSTMGLNFLHDRDPLKTLSEKQFMEEVNEVRLILFANGVDLCAQNTQNCLCEFSKYVRAKYFGKRLKSGYVPAAPTR